MAGLGRFPVVIDQDLLGSNKAQSILLVKLSSVRYWTSTTVILDLGPAWHEEQVLGPDSI